MTRRSASSRPLDTAAQMRGNLVLWTLNPRIPGNSSRRCEESRMTTAGVLARGAAASWGQILNRYFFHALPPTRVAAPASDPLGPDREKPHDSRSDPVRTPLRATISPPYVPI